MAHLPRSLLFAALSATLLAALLAGTAFLACGPDGARCATKTHTFLESPELPDKMDVDVIEGEAAHAHAHHRHRDTEGQLDWKKLGKKIIDVGQTKLQQFRDKIQTRMDPSSIWGNIKEDDRDPNEIECGEQYLPVQEKLADGTWPEGIDASRDGRKVECNKGAVEAGDLTYECSGVDLLSFIPLGDFFGSLKANDVWGWTDPENQKEYAIIGLGEGTGFVDISIPTRPVVVAVLPTHTRSSTWRDIKVYDNRAYIVSEARGHGMQVFDLTTLRGLTSPPVAPAEPMQTYGVVDSDDFSLGSAHNIVINEATGRAFVVGARNKEGTQRACEGGLVIIDIRNPAPVFEHCFSSDGYTHDAQCVMYEKGPDMEHRNKEICIAYNEDTVTVVDVTRGRAPTQISRKGYEDPHYTHQGWFDEQQTYVYVNDELDEMNMADKRTRTLIFDLTDLDNPKFFDTYRHETESIDHNNYILDGYIYQGNYCAGMRVLKIQEDHRVKEVAFFDTEPQCAEARFEGVWSVYPYFKSKTIVVSSLPKGLFMLKVQEGIIST